MSDNDNKSFGQKHKSTLRAAMLTVVIVGSVLITRAAGLFVPLELMAYDLAVRTLVDANADERIVLVNRSEEDLRALGYPTSDNLLTDVLEKIAAGKDRVGTTRRGGANGLPVGCAKIFVWSAAAMHGEVHKI